MHSSTMQDFHNLFLFGNTQTISWKRSFRFPFTQIFLYLFIFLCFFLSWTTTFDLHIVFYAFFNNEDLIITFRLKILRWLRENVYLDFSLYRFFWILKKLCYNIWPTSIILYTLQLCKKALSKGKKTTYIKLQNTIAQSFLKPGKEPPRIMNGIEKTNVAFLTCQRKQKLWLKHRINHSHGLGNSRTSDCLTT